MVIPIIIYAVKIKRSTTFYNASTNLNSQEVGHKGFWTGLIVAGASLIAGICGLVQALLICKFRWFIMFPVSNEKTSIN
jgi:hypothetical protein